MSKLASRRSLLVWAIILPLTVFLLLAATVPRSGALTWEDALLRRLGELVEHAVLIRLADLGLFAVTLGAIVATAFVAGVLVGRSRYGDAAVVGSTLIAAFVFERVMKTLIHREPFNRVDESDYSFPSGGAMFSAALLGAIFLAAETPRQRRLAAALGAGLMLSFGVALVVFGWHYPTDVLAGWCAMVALVTAGWLFVHR